MAREVITRVWCDVCMDADDERVEGTETPPVVLGAMKPRVLALCPRHMKEVYDPFKELLADLGQVVPNYTPPTGKRQDGSSSGSGVYPCPFPDCPKGSKPFRHIQSLRNHTRDVHNTPITEVKERFGDPETYAATVPAAPDLFDTPEPKEEKVPAVTRAECPECPTVYEWPENKRPAQALGVHRRSAHGVRSPKKGQG